ncbi:DeoR/GlpR family DNA-binding transcription regulator [Fictibacillus gelatini]|uniref:DeoR/GlpR family DNA-binding transcription regulator n=1 Tax=Fictibacillus gelatini TaxID=225985 RepID=UPI000410C4A0|nr:DeoR/GlpR family DNA-binding transcription regulator [Fictibacillus gelatini]
MYQDERMTAILKYLSNHDRIDIETICEMNNVSRDTARRDLVKLEELGKIVRTRGGAKLPSFTYEVHNYEQRLKKASHIKSQIGKFAATLIRDGDHIILDASTTVQFVAENLASRNNTVVTNSIDIASILSQKEDTTIHLLGGSLNNKHRSIYGSRTIEQVSDYKVNKLFLGACGISAEGLSVPVEEEGYLMREMIKRSDKVIVLTDSTKFNKTFFQKVCDLDAIDIVVTDEKIDQNMKEIVENYSIELMIVPGSKSEES